MISRFASSYVVAVLLVFFVPRTAMAQTHKGIGLEHAYKKEFSYLEAQKSSLTTRLKRIKKEHKRIQDNAQIEVDRLQGRLLGLQRKADVLEQELGDVERDALGVDDDADVLGNTLEQARASLIDLGVSLEPLDQTTDKDPHVRSLAQVQHLDQAFVHALTQLSAFQSVRHEKKAFFTHDGTRIEGDVVTLGRIASYGIAAKGEGVLAPAGEGRLKLWHDSKHHELAKISARAIASSKPIDHVGIFLYESLKKNVEEKKAQSVSEVVKAGGLTAYVIVALGVLGFLLVFFRFIILGIHGTGSSALLARLEPLIVRREFKSAQELCGTKNTAASRVLKSTLLALARPRAELEDVIAEALLREAPRLERFGSAITVFAAVAPLLGLLGTVTGMISTFDIITEFGTGDPRMLSGGISEALITTQLGLVVAIPLLMLGNLTTGVARNVQTNLERAALRLMNLTDRAYTPEVI